MYEISETLILSEIKTPKERMINNTKKSNILSINSVVVDLIFPPKILENENIL